MLWLPVPPMLCRPPHSCLQLETPLPPQPPPRSFSPSPSPRSPRSSLPLLGVAHSSHLRFGVKDSIITTSRTLLPGRPCSSVVLGVCGTQAEAIEGRQTPHSSKSDPSSVHLIFVAIKLLFPDEKHSQPRHALHKREKETRLRLLLPCRLPLLWAPGPWVQPV